MDIDWIEELELKQVIIECDSQVVVKAVRDESRYYTEVTLWIIAV